LPKSDDLFRHQFEKRSDGEVGGRLFLGKCPVHGADKGLLDLGAGEPIGGFAELREVELAG